MLAISYSHTVFLYPTYTEQVEEAPCIFPTQSRDQNGRSDLVTVLSTLQPFIDKALADRRHHQQGDCSKYTD